MCSVANDEVPGLGDRERRLDGLQVAHFADQDDVGVFTQGVLERTLERRSWCRVPIFALVDDAALVRDGWNSIGSSTVMMCPFRVAIDA